MGNPSDEYCSLCHSDWVIRSLWHSAMACDVLVSVGELEQRTPQDVVEASSEARFKRQLRISDFT